MNWFKDCTTIEEIKKLYKALAMQNHPDKGGNLEVMQDINREYSFAVAKALKGGTFTAEEINNEILKNEKYRNAIEKIMSLEGIEIELVGKWIWVTGNTKPHKEKLKEANFNFAFKKKCWFFRSDEYKFHKRNCENLSLDEIKERYGNEKVKRTYKANFINN